MRVRWDGRTSTGSLAPEGAYRLRVSLRRGGRAVTLNPGLSIDTTAPRPDRARGRSGRQPMDHRPDRRSRAAPGAAWCPSASRRACASCGPTSATRATSRRFELPPGVREGEWDGMAGGAPAPPGTYQLVAEVRDQAGNVGRSAPDGPGPVRGAAGRERAHAARAARPPIRSAPGSRSRSPSTRAGGRTDGGSSGSAPRSSRAAYGAGARGATSRRARAASRRAASSPSARRRARPGSTCCASRSGPHTTIVPFAVQGKRAAPILVVLPAATWFGRDTLDDDRDGIPNTLENGERRGVPAAAGRRAAGGLRRRRRGAARVPRRPGDPLRPDDRPHAGRVALRPHRRAPGRAARGPVPLGVDRPGAAPAPVRERGRARRDVRRRLAAARRRRRARSARSGRCRRPDADPFGARLRPLRRLPRSGAAAADRRRGRDRAADRRRGAARVLAARGVRAVRRACGSRSRSSTRRRSRRPRRPASRCRRRTPPWR